MNQSLEKHKAVKLKQLIEAVRKARGNHNKLYYSYL